MFLLISFYLQTVTGYSALRTGVAFLPFAVAVLIAFMTVSVIMSRLPAGRLLAAGVLVTAAGMGWLTRLGVASGYSGHVLPALLLLGAGVGMLSPVAANLATFGVAEHDTGVASAVFNASEQIGASMGAALANTIAPTSTAAFLASHTGDGRTGLAAVVHGYTVATGWAAGILAVGAIVILVLVKVTLKRHEPPASAANDVRFES